MMTGRALRLPKVRLRTTLMVPFLLQIVTAVGLVGYLSFRNGQRAVNDLAHQLTEETSVRIEQQVLTYLNKSQNTLWLNHAGIQSGNFDLTELEKLRRYFWRVVRDGEYEGYLSYGNEKGEFVGVEHRDNGTVQLKIRTEATAPMRETFVLNSQGERQQRLKVSEYDPRKRPWYRAAVEAGKPTWSAIYPFFSSKKTVLGLSPVYPVYEGQTLLGVLCINVRLTRITDFIDELSISPNGQSFIVERSGDLVAGSRIPQPFEVIVEEEQREIKRIPATQSDNPVVQATAQQIQDRLGGFIRLKGDQNLDFEMNGDRYYAHILPIQDGRGIDWFTVVVVPEQDFMAQINRNTRNTIVLCLGALGVAISIGILTARWVARPILDVAEASDQLAQGDLEQRVTASPIVEVDNLAESFNTMASGLQQSFAALEQKNEDLRIAEENYRSIFENALEGIFQSSPEGHYINVNPALAKIYGYDSPQDMINSVTNIGRQLYVDPKRRSEFRDLLRQQGMIKNYEYECYCKDGQIIWNQVDARVVKDKQGEILYYEGIVQDITERKQREAKLQQQLEELQIEIDQKQRKEEVSVLTGSSYFQEVQQEVSAIDLDEFWS